MIAPAERSEIVEHLERSRQEFMAAVAGLTEAQAKARSDPERWSVLDCVEHVTRAEERFLGWLEAAKKLDAPRVDKEKEAGLMARITDRSTRAKSPEAVLPAGRFTTLGQALEQFNVERTRSIEFAQDRGDDLYCLTAEHPRFGPINGVEFLIIIAGHSRRHAAQILEARAGLAVA